MVLSATSVCYCLCNMPSSGGKPVSPADAESQAGAGTGVVMGTWAHMALLPHPLPPSVMLLLQGLPMPAHPTWQSPAKGIKQAA